MKKNDELKELRTAIDMTDKLILNAYEDRLEFVRKIAEYKKNNQKNIFDKAREEEKFKFVEKNTEYEDNLEYTKDFFKYIMTKSKKLQEDLILESDVLNKIDSLVTYRDFDKLGIIKKYAADRDEKEFIVSLLKFADKYCLSGDLWKLYLNYCLISNDNIYFNLNNKSDSLKFLFIEDLKVIKKLYELDLSFLNIESIIIEDLKNYKSLLNDRGYLFDIKDQIESLDIDKNTSLEEIISVLEKFNEECGFGLFGLNRAFYIKEKINNEIEFVPISSIPKFKFSDIILYERQKKELLDNTEAFLLGKQANNVLLFGDSGTGKSSSIKALINKYYKKGLRIIEVYKQQIPYIINIFEALRYKKHKFIIYFDDLSFEENEVEYKYLKAILEGSIGEKPHNVLIYASSNRRHIIREKFTDKLDIDDELHRRDGVEEKISLFTRFGLSIYFDSLDKKEYNELILALAKKNKINISEEDLLDKANKWEIKHYGRCGRVAKQFISFLLASKE